MGKGQIELISTFRILAKGDKVSASAAVLLGKLGIRPFNYKMEVEMVFQGGAVFPAAVLDIQESVLIQKFLSGVANMAAFSREIGIPTEAGLGRPRSVCCRKPRCGRTNVIISRSHSGEEGR